MFTDAALLIIGDMGGVCAVQVYFQRNYLVYKPAALPIVKPHHFLPVLSFRFTLMVSTLSLLKSHQRIPGGYKHFPNLSISPCLV
jgi:hypothetical protein